LTCVGANGPDRNAALVAGLVGLSVVATSAPATAQLRWDFGGELGVLEQLKGSRPSDALHHPNELPGPVAELHGDVALVPMVRMGAHVAFDLAPLGGLPVERMLEGGAQVKFAPPLLAHPWRTWAEVGLGYAWAYEPGYPSSPGPGVARVEGSSGGVFDVPIGVALGYRASRGLEPFVEVGARFGVGFAGALYTPPYPCSCSSPFLGRDVVALSLSLGLNSNQ
jgi:hypothetical protein